MSSNKLRPFETNFQEYQSHGDDTQIQISKDLEKPLQSISSSSNEFSFDMTMKITDTSNEALKTDDENGMIKSYFVSNHPQKEKNLISSDVSLQQQQQLPMNECEYEIDLGNGYITKSISSYQKQRTLSIISADSIQPITTFKIPFTNTIPKLELNQKEEEEIRTNVLFNIQQQWSKLSFRTITIFSLSTTIIIFLIVILFFVF